jgi:hypothetical protein
MVNTAINVNPGRFHKVRPASAKFLNAMHHPIHSL